MSLAHAHQCLFPIDITNHKNLSVDELATLLAPKFLSIQIRPVTGLVTVPDESEDVSSSFDSSSASLSEQLIIKIDKSIICIRLDFI
jgi:hypothetical protein